MAGRLQTAATVLKQRYDRFTAALNGTQRRLFEVFIFLALFTVFSAPLYLLIESGWEAHTLRAWTAGVSSIVLELIGISNVHSGTRIVAESFVVDVSRDSTGWKSVLAFTALVLASRRSLRYTAAGILIGGVVLVGANLLRITSMMYLVAVSTIPYELLHTVLWRWGLTFTVLGAWFIWLYLADLER